MIIYRHFDLEIQSNSSEEEVYLPCIGDSSCNYNAHSPYIRCAVNPDGPCDNCTYYEPQSSPNSSPNNE